jgi:hypothetical protein
MPIPTSALDHNVIPRLCTPRTTLEELLALFAEHPEPDLASAIVRVGADEYAVLRQSDLDRVLERDGNRALQRALGNLPTLGLHLTAAPALRQDEYDEQQARDELGRLGARAAVVVDANGEILGILAGRERNIAKGPAVLGGHEPVPFTATSGAVSTRPHLNTRFEGLEPGQALLVGQAVPLAVWVGAPTATNSAQSSQAFQFEFPPDSDPVAFRVNVDADPEAWQIEDVESVLVVAPPGATTQEARFNVKALLPGRDKLHISIERADTGATIQHVWLRVSAANASTVPAPLSPVAERVVTSTPFDTTQTTRRGVEIVIGAATEGFEATVRADLPGGAVRETYRVPVSVAEIQNATYRLRQELENVVFYAVQQGGQTIYPFADLETVTVDEATARQALAPLADVGQQYWHLLFQGPRAPEGLKRLANEMRAMPEGSTFQVVVESQQFIVPWALLYDKPGAITAETLDWSGFWGYRYILDVLPPGRYPAPQMTQMPLSLQLLFNDETPLRQFTSEQEQVIRQQPGGTVATVDRGHAAIQQRLTQPNSVAFLYLYCHGTQVSGAFQLGPMASESALSFSRHQQLRLADLRRLPVAPLDGQPLVFLNACEGATQDAFFYDGFMPFFVEELGARGFIGTEVKAPQRLAHDIALRFWNDFTSGQPIGEILWHIRRDYLDQHNNILAFNYSLYCLSEVRLAQPLDSSVA